MRDRARLLAVPVALAMLATACGSDRNSDSASTSSAVTTAAPTTTAG